jgi:hypothetical protein
MKDYFLILWWEAEDFLANVGIVANLIKPNSNMTTMNATLEASMISNIDRLGL